MELLHNVFLYYLYSAAAVLLLFFAVIAQRSRIRKLEEELDDITLKFQKQASGPKNIHEELFEYCPFPICMVNMRGGITAGNKAFAALTEKPVASLAEFDAVSGGELQRLPLESRRFTHKLVTLRRQNSTPLRQFNVIAWPVMGKSVQMGSVISFHEQTHVLRRKSQQLHFEQQLVTYMSLVASQLELLSKNPHAPRTIIDEYSQEMRLLTAYLQGIHTQVRQPNPHGAIDVAKLCKEVIGEYRKDMRAKQLHVISALPKSVLAIGNQADLLLTLRTLFSAVILQADKTSSVRIDIQATRHRVIVEWSLPEQPLDERDIRHAFSFGINDPETASETRLWRLQLAMAREVASKHNGHITIASHEEIGTLYRLTLVAAKGE